ncbi:MAG: chemotaxis protein CheX [Planctomycetota bacterium]
MFLDIPTKELSNQLANTVTMVFGSMIGVQVGPSELIEGKPRSIPGDVMAIITVSAPDSTAIVTLQCDAPLAKAIYTGMFGEAPAAGSEDDVYDAVAEMANVIVGNFKSTLNKTNQGLVRMSVSTLIIAGRQIPTPLPAQARWFAVKFVIENCHLYGSMFITMN